MLIIAIPKSASTALMHTIRKACRIPAEQLVFPVEEVPENCRILHEYHSDVRSVPDKYIKAFYSQHKLYKQHVYPTDANLRKLRHLKKIILLREVDEIIAAYWRAIRKHIHKEREELTVHSQLEEWMEEAKDIGLYHDLQFFHEQWTAEAKQYPQYNLIINYSELLNDPDITTRKILDFMGISAPNKEIHLAKKRYSRGSSARNLWNYILRKLE
jgi:hypothetical protein